MGENTSMCCLQIQVNGKNIHVLVSDLSKWEKKNIDVLSSDLSKWEKKNIDVLSSGLSKWEKIHRCVVFRFK